MYFQNFKSSSVLEKKKNSDCVRNVPRRCDLDVVKNFTLLPHPFYSNWFSDTSGRLIVHCRWRYRISYQFFPVYRVPFLFRYVVLALVECLDARRSATKSSASLQRRETGKVDGSKTFSRLREELDSISEGSPFRSGRKKSAPRFLTGLREAAESFIYIRSRTDSVSRFVRIYCRDHFASSLSKSLSRVADIYIYIFFKFHLRRPPRNANCPQTRHFSARFKWTLLQRSVSLLH